MVHLPIPLIRTVIHCFVSEQIVGYYKTTRNSACMDHLFPAQVTVYSYSLRPNVETLHRNIEIIIFSH